MKTSVAPWINTTCIDGGNIEIRSTHEHKTLKPLLKDYTKLINYLDSAGYYPSSVIDRNVEGGCHINFNLANKTSNINNTGIVKKFVDNIVGFLNNYPSIVWSYLAPEDNASSNILTHVEHDVYLYEKGNCITIRQQGGNMGCIELRFFMMPKTIQEFSFIIRSADAILKYLWNETLNGKSWSIKNTPIGLKTYTLTRALKEINKLLPILGISKEEFTKYDKFTALKERFEFNTDYLV